MAKELFVGEYPINASKKMLYPYISTASGLSQWFADDVNINEDKQYTFIWDGDENKAKMVGSRVNSFARFEFDGEDDDEPPYIEFRLEMNDLTQEVFIRISDYSEIDQDELQELYESLVHDLKEIVGG
ncbi:START-like domain-containing protein [Marinoscillum sp. MHG1-6]|uniref:START-like domain-containing protein n=1 Tax=Marinoscillum sp. MHG1-6 TaxID=2959627 RepID=UPI0021580698|nr:START-like domain-containing protein [Marinoscillum sp. MHG1-6]